LAKSSNKKKKIKLDRNSWLLIKRLVDEHVRQYLRVIAISLVCMGIAAGATAALAVYVEPLINGMRQGAKVEEGALYTLAASLLVIFVVKGLATFGQQVSMNWVGQRVIADLQTRLYQHFIKADLAYFQANPTGSLISRFTNDVNRMRIAVTDALTGVGLHTLTVIGLFAVMFYMDWVLALMSFIIVPTAVLPIVRIGRRMRKISRVSQVELGKFTTFLEETFLGVRHVKAYGMEQYETERAKTIIERLFGLHYKAFRTRLASHPIMETLGGVIIVGVLLYGGQQVIFAGKSPGAFGAFVTSAILAYAPMKRLSLINASLQDGLAAADRVFVALDTMPSIREREGATELALTKGQVEFENVSFAYVKDIPALSGVSLRIPADSTVALVGPSGAGKSTILNMIPRFYEVDDGRITIDGTDIRDVTLASLRANIGLVSQEISLFDDTVRANIAYGRPEASDAEIVEAAKRAAAHDFISQLPDGYETSVGGQGARLSGGQRQRVAIARAILKNPKILLLDEATSALDTESERQVQTALKELMTGRTTLVIAHRLSTIQDADIIYIIENGRVIESGNHAKLLSEGGAYAKLYTMQLVEKDDAPEDDGLARTA